MWPFKKHKISYDDLIFKLERGNHHDHQELLWHKKTKRVNYLPVTSHILHTLQKPKASADRLSIFKTITRGNFELIIFRTPWSDSRSKLTPLLLEVSSGTVVGSILPFNELHGLFSRRALKQMGALTAQWIVISLPLEHPGFLSDSTT